MPHTFSVDGESTPKTVAMISESGSKRLNPTGFSGLKPTGRSANSSTRCSTPFVSFLRHTGQILPSLVASTGDHDTLQFRWPVQWYFPYAGSVSIVNLKRSLSLERIVSSI